MLVSNPNAPWIKSEWTRDRIAILRAIYLDGSNAWVAGQINAQTGSSFSRNAVIGKAHRIGLDRPRNVNPPEKKHLPRKQRRKRFVFGHNHNSVVLDTMPIPEPELNELEIPIEQRCSILQLTDDTCHWIIGDTQDPAHFYCGAITIRDRPWCAYHAKKATDGHATSASSRKQLSRLALWRD